jgi:hypothetical protein
LISIQHQSSALFKMALTQTRFEYVPHATVQLHGLLTVASQLHQSDADGRSWIRSTTSLLSPPQNLVQII